MFVRDVMTREPTTVTHGTTIKRAAELLAELQVTCLPVIDTDGRLCGVVSEADLIRDAFSADPRSHILAGSHAVQLRAHLISEVMTARVVTVRESTDLAQAVELMTSATLKSLPVVNDQQHVVGVVSRSDIVRLRARSDDDIRCEVDSLLASLGHADWQVEVSDGSARIAGPATTRDRSLAETAASTVAGVVTVKVR
jgi:CBS domain-containing protein